MTVDPRLVDLTHYFDARGLPHAEIRQVGFADLQRNRGESVLHLGETSSEGALIIGRRHDSSRETEYWLSAAEMDAIPPQLRQYLADMPAGDFCHGWSGRPNWIEAAS